MNRDDVEWRGYWPASPTPFTRTGALDRDGLRGVIRRYLDDAVHGLLINGSSGEWFSQSLDEREEVAAIAVDEVGGVVPVVIGCSALRLIEVQELSRHASEIGASGILVTAPPYVRPSPDEIVEFFRSISATAKLPIMVYNIPRRVGVEIDSQTALRLAELELVVAIKNDVPEQEFFASLGILAPRLRVFGTYFCGEDGRAALEVAGGDGYIGGWEVLGHELPEFFEAFWAGDRARATELGDRERALDAELWDGERKPRFARSFQSQLKAALNLIGLPAGYPRPPLLPLDPPQLAELRRLLIDYGVVAPSGAE